ncbi:monooxygenase [Brevibacillus antibioticus]|uniref:Monooxygenase n=1 Tax=Brevibacillus antibioticus TaxID=2570228 RepID=A0A4U2Y6B7_9BACL|nr:monooxygenase [Brevibacillus antibioticus]TKI56120.1 monooxygenase [Brevibacillus antibioticus]
MQFDYEVIIVGGGPVGMLLAAELALAKVKVCVLERLRETTPYSRALTVHPRTLEILDMRGLKAKLLERGKPIATGHFAALDTRLDFSVLDSSSNYTLILPQHDTEKVLEEWAKSLGVEIRREEEVVAVHQDQHGVEVEAVGPNGKAVLKALYVVGADGAASIVRKHAGIPFIGKNATFTAIQGDVVLKNPPESGVPSYFNEKGMVMIVPLPAGMHRVVLIDPERMTVPKEEPVSLEELRSSLQRILGDDLGISDPFWMTRFGNATLQAQRYRDGRIFLAGDAAHIHFPAGGQGMNVGLQEAINLGWKLAAQVKGWAPDWLLDSYHTERFPINTALLTNTQVQSLLFGGSEFSPTINALRNMVSNLLQIPEANYQLATQISAFNVQYEPDGERQPHVLNGRRFTELNLRLENGVCQHAYELFHSGSFLLLHFGWDEQLYDGLDWSKYKHVLVVRASLAKETADWHDVHTALIRPDGYVAWAVSQSESNPMEAIRKGIAHWCGRDSLQ